jgi:glycosyltransferase involved in cell wall biosynthesis
MKIAILSPFFPYRGGIAQFSLSLYKTLLKEHEVKVFSFSRLYPCLFFPGVTQYVEENKIISIQSERLLDSVNPYSYWKTAKGIENFNPRILIVAYWTSFFNLPYGYIAWYLKNKVKIIFLLHNAFDHEYIFFSKFITRWVFNQCNNFIVMSEVVKKDLLTMNRHASYCLSPHPVYDHFGQKIEQSIARKILNFSQKKRILLFFGLIRDYKGLDLLIDAFSLLSKSYQLVIAGEPYGSFKKYQKKIDTCCIKNRIKVLNKYINNKEVQLLFSATDILVLPYKSASQSGVISIAYNFEVPIVATNVGGLIETIEKFNTGVICKAEVVSLACGIEKIFTIGIKNFLINIQNAKKNLSWEEFVKKIITFTSKSLNC